MSQQLQELIRKQNELNSKKRSRNETYHSPKKSRKRQHAFDAPQISAYQVPPSSSSSDDESIQSKYERNTDGDFVRIRTPRKKVQPPWIFIGHKINAAETPDAIKTWLTDYADAEMLRAGPYATGRRSQPDDVGPFKIAQVCIIAIQIW
jgi:hypothetical protein